MKEEKVSGGEMTPSTPPDETVNDTSNSDSVASVEQTPLMNLPPLTESGGAVGSQSEQAPIMNELNGGEYGNDMDAGIFEEIPQEVCTQMYTSALQIGFALRHKGEPVKDLPKQRAESQGAIIYGILKKNQVSIKYIEYFMLGAGMLADWKYMNAYNQDEFKEEDDNK